MNVLGKNNYIFIIYNLLLIFLYEQLNLPLKNGIKIEYKYKLHIIIKQ